MADKPDCYKCAHKRSVPGDAHIRCEAPAGTKVEGNEHGKRRGWFSWPWNFDPCWLVSCDGFTPREAAPVPFRPDPHCNDGE